MNIPKNTPSERLAAFRALYQNAKDRFSEQTAAFDRHMAQYRGSTEIDGSDEPASTVRNITYEIVESQISSQIPLPKVDAEQYSEKRDRNAKAIERLCAAVRDKLPFEEMNDLDERYTYIYGGSVWFVEWDSAEGEDGGVRVHCLSPKNLIPQPGICRVEDMDYCFLRFTTTKCDLVRRYGVKEEDLPLADIEEDETADLADGEIATVVLCFYRGDDRAVGQFVFSGDLILLDLPDTYRRKAMRCKTCGEPLNACRCGHTKPILGDETEETVRRSVRQTPTGAEEVFFGKDTPVPDGEKTALRDFRVPYYTPKRFPIVVRRNTSGENMLFGQSDCEFLRPEQQAINKIESRILQKLLRAGVTPVMPEDATVSLNNSVFGQVIKMKPGDSAAQYGKVDTTPDISQDIAEAERLYLHAKRTLGISDAYQGIGDNRAESGYARQLQISQASGRLESKKKMKYTAYADIDRLIFEYYLAYSDEPRTLSYRDAYGRIHNASFNRYDFLAYDEKDETYRYDDAYLFSVDLNGGAEGQRAELWQKNLENLRSGALGDTGSPVTLLRYWQCQERAHYPFARENVEYFTDAVERMKRPDAKGDESDL